MNSDPGRYVFRTTVTARQFTSEADLGIFAASGEARVGDWLVRRSLDSYVVVSGEVFAEEFEPQGHYHDATGCEDTLCRCPSPLTYAPQWPQAETISTEET
jgi:hypothetical protein